MFLHIFIISLETKKEFRIFFAESSVNFYKKKKANLQGKLKMSIRKMFTKGERRIDESERRKRRNKNDEEGLGSAARRSARVGGCRMKVGRRR